MAAVGLLFVGAVLFLNGVMLLGKIDLRANAVFNLFVGALQVVTPTYLIFTAAGDPNLILAASGIYLFGFTYLFVGIGLLGGLDASGVGWFSLFVSIMAIGYSIANFLLLGDQPFGVIWLYWSFLWFLFFLVFGLKIERLTIYTGWVTAIEGWVTGAIPAFLILTGYWQTSATTAIALAIFGVVVFAALWMVTSGRLPSVYEPARRPAGPVTPT